MILTFNKMVQLIVTLLNAVCHIVDVDDWSYCFPEWYSSRAATASRAAVNGIIVDYSGLVVAKDFQPRIHINQVIFKIVN